MNVILPPNTWVDLYVATGITVGNAIKVTALNAAGAHVAVKATQPTPQDSILPVAYDGCGVENKAGDPGAWALSVAGSAVDVVEVA